MTAKTPELDSQQAPKKDERTPTSPEIGDALSEVAAEIRRDAKNQPAEYLDQSKVPAGGE